MAQAAITTATQDIPRWVIIAAIRKPVHSYVNPAGLGLGVIKQSAIKGVFTDFVIDQDVAIAWMVGLASNVTSVSPFQVVSTANVILILHLEAPNHILVNATTVGWECCVT
ncbi:hypothetical protein FGIG_03999 [Fasciola gigantica]|uniref:Uncharacterized protein n=1 Tax=Fasciola gigantica TaxID=46835 RepID=A0A504YT11_FASGI|nr:hypothetical protein FGIG_03999 [Fasciola gigantica]